MGKPITSTHKMLTKILLTFLTLYLVVDALPSPSATSESMKNVKTVNGDQFYYSVNDESDNSSGKKSDKNNLPVVRYDGGMNERSRLMGRENDAPSKCGYEVRRPIYRFRRLKLRNYSI